MRWVSAWAASARSVKHAGFLARKSMRTTYRNKKFNYATVLFRDVERVLPWTYRPARFRNTFLALDLAPEVPSALPAWVFVVWTGHNELTPNRLRNLERLRSELGLPLVLVTPETLPKWIVPGAPLHPAYEDLALMHRADYLRAYLMHHHGGGYADIKAPLGQWTGSFDEMLSDESVWVTSYASTYANWIGKLKGRLGRTILVRYRLVFGKGAFIMRSHTPLTAEWLAEVEAVLDRRVSHLSANPAIEPYGSDGYPLSWHDLLSRILDPLTLKYHEHIRYDDRLLLDFENYR